MKQSIMALALGASMMAGANAPPDAATSPRVPAGPRSVQIFPERSQIVPIVAAHQHLLGPDSVPQPPAPAPAIKLPPELERLLRDREQVSGSRASRSPAIGDVFAQDALLMKREGTWARGIAEVETILGFHGGGVRYVPNAYGVGDSAGHIAGTIRDEDSSRDLLTFVLGTRKGTDGKWRIASEVAARIPPPEFTEPVTADQLVADMNDAGIQRGVVLSIAYWFGSVFQDKPVENEAAKVRAENDWTAQQVARHPTRLVFFCGVNPLKEYAIAEVERCAKMPLMKGIKLHFANSGVDVRKPEHLEKLRRFFQAVNSHRLAMTIHVRSLLGTYGRADAEIFLKELLPAAPDVPIQLAHLAGAGPGYGPDAAMAVYAEAIAAGDPRTRNLYFDTTNCVTLQSDQSKEELDLIAKRLRQVGLKRVFFGSDMHITTNPAPGVWWWALRNKLPLTDEELKVIAGNVPPYMR